MITHIPVTKVENIAVNIMESKDSSIVCRYGKLDMCSDLYIGYVESKDRTKIKKHCVVAETLLDIEKYINSLTE